MSQYPPPPPGMTPPPGMMPPMQGMPAMPPARKSNGAAIGSLVCGLLFCVPFLTGIIAVILGIVGIRKGSDPQRGGKGMAIAGLLLGILSLGGWTLFGGGIWALFSGTAEQRQIAKDFITELNTGDTAAAEKKCTSTITSAEIALASQQMKAYGAIKDLTAVGASVKTGAGESMTAVGVQAVFANSTHTIQIEFIKENNAWKIRKWTIQ